MLLYCSRFKKLTFDNMNSTFGLELHRSYWLEGVHEIGSFAESCNYLDDMQLQPESHTVLPMFYETLGGPWSREGRNMSGLLLAEWFSARDDATKLWD